jgi:hypothetical protein
MRPVHVRDFPELRALTTNLIGERGESPLVPQARHNDR